MPVYKVDITTIDSFYYEADSEDEAIKYCQEHGIHWIASLIEGITHDEQRRIMADSKMVASLVDGDEVDPDLICTVKE